MAENYGSLTGTLDAHDTLEGNLDNHGEMSGEVQFGGAGSKVDDVLVNGESVVENKIAHIDLTPYAEIENVYDKTTIDTALGGKADVEDIPTDLFELHDDADHRTVTDAEKTEWSGKADTSDIPTALSQLTNDDNYVQDEHYQHTDNNYTDNEKSKLADIESGAEANVQSDWNESDTSSDAYILNKPTIPSVVANPQNTTATLTSIGIDGTNYAIQGGGGGGAVNSVNGMTGDVVLDAEDVGALPDDTPLFSGSYNDLSDKPTIPSALADLTDDSTHRVVTDTEKTTWNGKSDFSGSYNDLTDKPTIPDAQIQSDWNQSDNTKVDFIKNKPTLGTAAAKDSTNAVTQNSTDLVESGAVWSAIDNLPEPMVFKGTLGVSGTIASLPTASSSNNGYTYKVITDGTYDGKSAKVGDVFTSNATEWVLIPSGDETFTDTWRSVKVDGTELLGSSITTGAVNFKSGTNVTVSGIGNDITISAQDTTYSKATAQADGLMSKEDFSKLSGVETGAQANVQSDWNESDSDSDAYILNKPQNLVQDASYVHTDNNYTTAEKTKLSGISTGANKTEASTTNGNIKIDNVETPVYRLKGNNTVLSTDRTPYLLREALSVTNASAYVREKLIGCSVAWNQLVQNGNFADSSGWNNSNATFSISRNIATFTASATGGGIYKSISALNGHKYLVSAKIKTTTVTEDVGISFMSRVSCQRTTSWQIVTEIQTATLTGNVNFFAGRDFRTSNWDAVQVQEAQCIDLTLAFGSSVADTLYAMTNNGGIDWLRNHNYPIDQYTQYGYNLVSSKPSAKKVVGKNLFDADILLQAEGWTKDSNGVYSGPTNTPYGIWKLANGGFPDIYFEPNKRYVFTCTGRVSVANKWMAFEYQYSDGTTSRKTFGNTTDATVTFVSDASKTVVAFGTIYGDVATCYMSNIQLEQGTTATTYAPYSCTTYSLGNTELRGHLIVQNGEIVAEGDVRESNGNVQRNYGIVDLSTLSWTGITIVDKPIWRASKSDAKSVPNSDTANCIAEKYVTIRVNAITDSSNAVVGIGAGSLVYVNNGSSTTTPTGYLIYELATPTTETSSPFADPMSLNGCTTEEYVDDRTIPVPVGHETQYMGQSEDVVEIPSIPHSDGTWTLKCQVSGGKAQYYWA